MSNTIVYSLGHSNVTLERFMEILKNINIVNIIDVRSNPVSSYVPHFNKEKLQKALEQNGFHYYYFGKNLGGRQEIEYESYTNTIIYKTAINEIEKIIQKNITAIMCSEKDFRFCHRRFITNTLIHNGYNVIQINVTKNQTINKQMKLSINEA